MTASALFDLVSRDWIEALADRLAAAGAGFYAALSYDGAMAWTPALAERRGGDGGVQRGTSAATRASGRRWGPRRGAAVAEAFARRGYAVRRGAEPLAARAGEARRLQRELVDGDRGGGGRGGSGGGGARGVRRGARRAAPRAARSGTADVLAIPGAPSAQSKITSVPRP